VTSASSPPESSGFADDSELLSALAPLSAAVALALFELAAELSGVRSQPGARSKDNPTQTAASCREIGRRDMQAAGKNGSARRVYSDLSRPGKNCILQLFPLAKFAAKLLTARKIATSAAILRIASCDPRSQWNYFHRLFGVPGESRKRTVPTVPIARFGNARNCRKIG
jgi:hypothetical protein